jgi:hypothetical protein
MKFLYIGFMGLCLLLVQCGTRREGQARQNQSNSAPRTNSSEMNMRLAYPRPDSAGKMFYLHAFYTAKDFEKVKQSALKEWRDELQQRFSAPFKTLHFGKYFEVAYRCSDYEAQQLERFTMPFFQEVYPRFFRYEPAYPFRIVYFSDKGEFSRCTKSTAYGFYQPTSRTLYTYSHSGEGTLWHELIHAFIDANIDHQIQQWFNEGLASFYEMAGVYQGKFYEGYTNWRLPLLQKMLKRRDYMPLPAFLAEDSMSEDNAYAKARFFFCYLWRHDKMDAFVKTYLYDLSARAKGESLGKLALAEAERLVGKEVADIEAEYKQWAMEMKPFQKLEKLKQR